MIKTLNHNKLFKAAIYLTIVWGVVMRLLVLLQNRALFIDEANVARNLFERDYGALTSVLSYEQYAPPIFLWITKFFAENLGYYEVALRLFPLVCGVVSLFLLLAVLKELVGLRYAIYPLLLFAGGFIFLKYATELKQYSSDFMVTLLLIYACLKTQKHIGKWGFALFWVALGTVALWLSMPSVFILFSVGLFWFVIALQQKNYCALGVVFGVTLLWFLQFGAYYLLVLKAQADSSYLQNFHADAFLLWPTSGANIKHNIKLLVNVVKQAGGNSVLALVINLFLLVLGGIWLLTKKRQTAVLFIVPLVLLVIAALLNKYALANRLVLFIQPVLLVLIGLGVAVMSSVNFKPLSVVLFLLLFVVAINHQNLWLFGKKYEYQEIGYALDKLSHLNKNYEHPHRLWVHHGATPSYVFYTQCYHDDILYKPLRANFTVKHLTWDDNYANLLNELKAGEQVWILMTSIYKAELEKRKAEMQAAKFLANQSIEKPGCYLYLFEKK